MRIAIVDDDAIIVKIVNNFITRYSDDKNIAITADSFSSGKEFLSVFEKNRYDVIFMDIYMNEINGVQTSQEIRKTDNECRIVFITTSDTHMMDAFSCHAFDYIIKPVSIERIYTVLDELVKVIPNADRYIEVSVGRTKQKLPFSRIISVLSSGHYVVINNDAGESSTVRMNFSEFCSVIETDRRFLSVNKGIIVNMEHIKEITDDACYLKNGEYFPVKVRDRKNVLTSWNEYISSH